MKDHKNIVVPFLSKINVPEWAVPEWAVPEWAVPEWQEFSNH
jgi:hypothetical protein